MKHEIGEWVNNYFTPYSEEGIKLLFVGSNVEFVNEQIKNVTLEVSADYPTVNISVSLDNVGFGNLIAGDWRIGEKVHFLLNLVFGECSGKNFYDLKGQYLRVAFARGITLIAIANITTGDYYLIKDFDQMKTAQEKILAKTY